MAGMVEEYKKNKRIRKISFRSGMSLIEMAIVILVISVLTAGLAAMLNSFSILRNSVEEGEMLKADVLSSRTAAIKSNQNVYLELNLDEESYRVYRFDRDVNLKEEIVIKPRSLSFLNSIVAVSTGSSNKITEKIITIPFLPDGSSQETAIYLGTADEIKSTIFIHRYGNSVEVFKGEKELNLENQLWKENLEEF